MIDVTDPNAPLSPTARDAILAFWFTELTPMQWFVADPAVDDAIRARFLSSYTALARTVPADWRADPKGILAAVIALDQFPRNMFRGTPGMFVTDELALSLATEAIARGLDQDLTLDERKFLYMPYQHSEDTAVQARSIELFSRFDVTTLDFAQRHKDIIDRFGRFPHRNQVLGRESTTTELEFLTQPGSSF